MPNVGINVGPMVAAMGILAGIIKARETGIGCEMEFAQSDAAAYMDWYRIETERAPAPWRTRSPATRPTTTSGARRLGRHVGGRALSDVRGQ